MAIFLCPQVKVAIMKLFDCYYNVIFQHGDLGSCQ